MKRKMRKEESGAGVAEVSEEREKGGWTEESRVGGHGEGREGGKAGRITAERG